MKTFLAAVLASTLLVGAAPGTAQASTHAEGTDRARLTMDDLLQAESLGDAWFSPDSQQIAFTRMSSTAARSSGGFDNSSLVGGRVFVAARSGGEPREIAGPTDAEPGKYYRLAYTNAWAPDGRGLLLVETSNGAYGLAYWNARTGTITSLPGRPESAFAVCDWTKNGIVYAVLAGERRQRGSNAQMLERLDAKWRSAWSGDAPQVTVSSANAVFETSQPPPGSLMIADRSDASAVKIAAGDYVSVFASPDGTRVAAIRLAENITEPLYWGGRRGELQIFELSAAGAKQVQRFDDLDVEFQAVAWAPSGDRLLVGGKLAGEKKSQARLYEIDMRSGRRREIALPSGVSLNDPDVAAGTGLLPIGWIGGQPAAVGARQSAAAVEAPSMGVGTRLDYGEAQSLRFDVYSFGAGAPKSLTSFASMSVRQFLAPEKADFALVTTDGALWRVTPGASPQRLSPQSAPPVMAFAVDQRYPAPPLRSAYFRSKKVERVALFVKGEDGAPQRRVLDLDSGRFGSAVSRAKFAAATPDLQATVSRITDGWAASLVLDDGRRSRQRRLASVNTELNERRVAPVESFTYSSGGKQLTGWVVLPPDAQPGVALPAVVSVYGGAVYGKGEAPSAAKPGFSLPVFSGQLLATEGFAVIYPSTPLGSGEATDVMSTLADTVVAAVDALASKGMIDPERVGVTGQSFGGFSTAAILAARSERFKAGVAMAGVYDWIYGYGIKALADTLTADGRDQVVETKMVESGQIRLGKPFWKDPAPYIRNSPIFHVEDIDAPLLLLHGDLDMGVTGLPGAERMYNALVRAGKEPALVRYWGEGHVASSEWAIRDQWSRITAWFRTYLMDRSDTT